MLELDTAASLAAIKAAMEKRGMTYDMLAEEMYMSRSGVRGWFNRHVVPPMPRLIDLCNIFGCELDDLVIVRRI